MSAADLSEKLGDFPVGAFMESTQASWETLQMDSDSLLDSLEAAMKRIVTTACPELNKLGEVGSTRKLNPSIYNRTQQPWFDAYC